MKNKNKRAYKKRVSIPNQFYLPQALVYKLQEKISSVPPDFLFQESTGLFFLSLVFKNTVKNWNFKSLDNYTPLSSELLRKYNTQYNHYFKYFLEVNLLEMQQHRNFKGIHECRKYRFTHEVRNSLYSDNAQFYTCTNKSLKRSNINDGKHEMSPSFLSATHLSKWFNEKLTINYDEAINMLDENSNADEKIGGKWFVESIKNNDFYGTRNAQTDNRMHSNLTNLPKEMRPFLRYEGEDLVNFDIKCSQPFFLVGIIEGLIKNTESLSSLLFEYNKEKNKQGRITKIHKESLRSYILQNLTETLYSKAFAKEWKVFKEWVLCSDLYSELDEILVPKDVEDEYLLCEQTNIWGRDILKHFVKKKTKEECVYKELKIYPDKRSMIKVIVLNILYGGNKYRCEEFHRFCKKFPKLCFVFDLIKIYNEDALALWLQQTESKCIIDNITKKIAILYPEMPLFTIHDSIATTRSWSESVDLKDIICNLIEEEIGFKPQISEERFCDECSMIKAE